MSRVVLLGLARTNLALARHFVREGADVLVYDDRSAEALGERVAQLDGLAVRFALGEGDLSVVDGADALYVTPGVRRDHALVRRAEQVGVRVSSEIELTFELCPVPIAGITGSAGKTTTTTLVGEMLRASGLPTFVGGNIGLPLIDRLDQIGPDARVVLELSSAMLEHLTVSPHVGAVLNVVPNHLDWHPSFEAYRDAKARILEFQGPDDVGVLGLDDPVARSLAERGRGRKLFFSLREEVAEGACRVGDRLTVAVGDVEGVICRRDEVKLRGEHNQLNVLAAATIAATRGATLEGISRVATTFTGVEHRIEPVRVIDGAAWYNDSKATSPDETNAALRSFVEPIVLLAGGRSKKAPLDEMAREIAARVRVLVVFGEMAEEIASAVMDAPGGERVEVRLAPSLAAAVALARGAARPGDVVLLSPSGTSFDAFQDFEHRGRAFKELVGALPERARA